MPSQINPIHRLDYINKNIIEFDIIERKLVVPSQIDPTYRLDYNNKNIIEFDHTCTLVSTVLKKRL